MPSPFPGMDPYLEDEEYWPSFHHNLSGAIQAQLIPLLRPKYFADVETTIVYEPVESSGARQMKPDVTILRETAAPYLPADFKISPAPLEQEVELEIEVKLFSVGIYTTQGRQLVTSVEILSPANKIVGSTAYQQYVRKRRRLFNSIAHLMEFDLLRRGSRIILGHNLPNAPYFATLSRAERRPTVEIWPLALSEPLPILPVPLLEPDRDVPLDLQTAVSTVYDNSGYDYRLDYSQPPPPPPLAAEEKKLLEQIRIQMAR
ncbi:MAG: DUF4058 family protein [Anaerolineae bacterium]